MWNRLMLQAAAVLLIVGLALVKAEPDLVQTKNGLVAGEAYEDHRVFHGIPFGQPPIDDLRFASPRPAFSWAPAIYNATQIPPACPGTLQAAFNLLPSFEVDENCLFLNVYTPNRERLTRPLPVMFWIYGGGFVLGDSWEVGAYDGSYIVSNRDVIIVTHNYRLGPFGFLVAEGGANGNYAFEDQRLALQWAIDNIANFGGDPQQITIFGESAGAISASTHLLSPLSAGMFQRAILQSNPFALQFKTREQQLELTNRLSKMVDCPEGDLACLRSVNWRRLALHLPTFPSGSENLIGDFLPWTGTIDGVNILKAPVDSYAAGEFYDVPVIWGINRDEMHLFQGLIETGIDAVNLLLGTNITLDIGPIAYNLIVGFVFKDKGDLVLDQYPPSLRENNLERITNLLTDYVFRCASRFAALQTVRNGTSAVYTYEFTHAPDWGKLFASLNRMCFVDKVCHAIELPYVWHVNQVAFLPIGGRFSPEEEKLSNDIINYWTSFAAGNVNGGNPSFTWPQFTEAGQALLDLNPNLSQKTWDQEKCDFWDSIGYNY